jgi:hypothetical protein
MPLTRSGVLVNAQGGTPTLEDITHSIAQMPRFAGHTRAAWSVLDHSVYCGWIAEPRRFPELQLAMLLHDAHECITGDIPSDVKPPAIRKLQNDLDVRIMDRYLPGGYAMYSRLMDQVHEIDKRALAAEALVLGPETVTDEWREKTFGAAAEEDVKLLLSIMPKTVHPDGVLEAITLLQDRCKR